MLFEGAIRSLERAEMGFGLEDPAESNETIHNNIHRTQEILHELNMALDVTNGGKLAETLRGLDPVSARGARRPGWDRPCHLVQ